MFILRSNPGTASKHFNSDPKYKSPPMHSVVEWLDSQPIPTDEQLFLPIIPDRKRKHPAKSRYEIVSKIFVEMDEAFRV